MRRASLLLLVTLPVTLALAAPRALALPARLRVQTYAPGLNFALDMAWVEDTKRIFFTEKDTGKVRVLVGRRLRRRACVDLPVNSSGERGALGIVVHPRFEHNHWLYVYYTKARPLQNRVTRFTVRNNRCRRSKPIVTRLPASSSGYHNGGQLEFVGGKLFVSVGEAHDPALAQSTRSRLGKILRVNSDGTIPRRNPFSHRGRRSAVWSYGHRNPFGLAQRPGTTQLFATENGPSCDDELNRIVRGRNYGWGGGYRCGSAGVGTNPRPPLVRWSSVIVPTDPGWYRGRLRSLSRALYMGDYSSGRLHRFDIGRRGNRVERRRVIYDAPAGIVDVEKGPGGWLYFVTPSAIKRIVRH
jgi:glucose/arabinose dehydrogenase